MDARTEKTESSTRTECHLDGRGTAPPPRQARGVTLLELVVALAVLAILVTIAHSSYRQHTLRAQRTAAKTALLRLHAEQEQLYARNGNSYTSDLTDMGYPLPSNAPIANGRYLLSVDPGANTTGFTARATARGRMADDDECLELTIDARGVRGATPDPYNRCW